MYELSIDRKSLNNLLRKLDDSVRPRVLIKSLKLSGSFLKGWIVESRLKGPRPKFLGRISARLSTSIQATEPEQISDGYQIRIGTNVEYARKHEFGFVGKEQVGAHTRKGHPVRAFTRNINLRARPFLRPALESRSNQLKVGLIFRDEILKELNKT